MSAIQDNQIQLKKITRRSIVSSTFIVLPMMAGLVAVAKPLVEILLGKKWLPCVPFLQIYCLIYAFWPIHTANLSAIKAMGKSNVFLKLEIVKKTLGLGILIATIIILKTPIGIAMGGAITAIISSFINAYPNKKLLDYSYFEQLWDILPSLILSIVMFFIVYSLAALKLAPMILLVIQIISGTLIYFISAKLLHFECLDYILKTLQEFKSGRKKN